MANIITRSVWRPIIPLCNIQTRQVSSTETLISEELSKAKPFSEVPGPWPLPIPKKFGNLWRFTWIGEYHNVEVHKLPRIMFNKYGPIVKLEGMAIPTMIYIQDAEDAEKVYRSEGQWPERRASVSMNHYRRNVRKDIFGDFLGVLTTQGEEWQHNRSALNPTMMKPQNVKCYHEPFQKIAKEFIARMRQLRDDKLELPADFHNELNKWSLESISYAALDSRIGCFESDKKSDGQIMISAVNELFDLMLKVDFMPSVSRLFPNAGLKRLIEVNDIITGVCMKYINNKLKEIQERPDDQSKGQSILEILLKGKNGRQVAITMALDMMMAGIDTTSNSSAFAIYNIATNPEVQEKLYQELKQILPNKTDSLPKDYSNSIPYLKACLKESHRVTPVVLGNVRTLQNDIVLKGYRIPKGTDAMMASMDMGKNEKYFKNAEKFIPERWFKGEDTGLALTHPFGFLPFGFGPRMCIGRRLAESEMYTLLSMIFRNFKVSFDYGEMKIAASIVNRPGVPLKFKIEERPE